MRRGLTALCLAATLAIPVAARAADPAVPLRLLLTGASAGWLEPCG